MQSECSSDNLIHDKDVDEFHSDKIYLKTMEKELYYTNNKLISK